LKGFSNLGTAFAAALRDLRTRANLSQEELALNCNLDRTYISLLERNKRQPTLTTFFVLSRGLGISASELLNVVEDKRKSIGLENE
jgi:transcriptional regulator with XRE-family HTH domain